MKRIVIGGIVGGAIVFLWGAFSHMVLLKGVGFTPLPHEDAVLEALKTSVPEAGLYFFPGLDLGATLTPAQETAWDAKYRSGPAGLLLYRPVGGEHLSPRQFLVELLSNVLAAALGAFLLSLMAAAYWPRVLAVGLLGLFAWLSISVSYWNWDGFPDSFILAEGVDQVAGWLIAGLAIARVVTPAARSAA